MEFVGKSETVAGIFCELEPRLEQSVAVVQYSYLNRNMEELLEDPELDDLLNDIANLAGSGTGIGSATNAAGANPLRNRGITKFTKLQNELLQMTSNPEEWGVALVTSPESGSEPSAEEKPADHKPIAEVAPHPTSTTSPPKDAAPATASESARKDTSSPSTPAPAATEDQPTPRKEADSGNKKTPVPPPKPKDIAITLELGVPPSSGMCVLFAVRL